MPNLSLKNINDIDYFLYYINKNNIKLVFTNGCFDLLHEGHIHLLKQAKKLGNKLLIALNSDESIKKIKGQNRPIDNLAKRVEKIAALDVVDFIITFDEETPLKLIQKIQPAVLVKGGDYTIANIVGANLVKDVVIIPLLEGYSTTKIIEKQK